MRKNIRFILRTLLVVFLVFSMEFTFLDCALAEEKDNTHKYNKILVEEKVEEHHYKNKIAEKYKEGPPAGWEKGKKEGWQGRDLPPGLGKKHEELEKLRKEDPEKFRKILAAHKQEMEKRLEELKRVDPEKYEKIIKEKKKHEELEKLRKEDPEKFRKILAAHKQEMEKRLEALKKTDPERYERIMQERKEHNYKNKIAEKYKEGPPAGWEKGKKEGWQGRDLPPRLSKKVNPEKYERTVQEKKESPRIKKDKE